MDVRSADELSLAAGVSVVIPAYNYAHYLPAAIDSALAQDYPDVEIIVVDDGSLDHCHEVAAGYGGRIRYVRQENAGLPAARNTGIQLASMPFIAFLDADDQWRPGMLNRVMETFLRLPEDFAMVACGAMLMDAEGILLRTKRLDQGRSGLIRVEDILMRTRFAPSATVVRRSAFQETGLFDTTLRSSEDRDMWIRMAARWNVYMIEDPLVLIRRHGSNMSRNTDRMKQNMRLVIAKARRSGAAAARSHLFWWKVDSFMCYQTAWMYFDEGRLGAACRDLLISILKWPLYLNPHQLNENFLFRIRSYLGFVRAGINRKWTTGLKPVGTDAVSGPCRGDL